MKLKEGSNWKMSLYLLKIKIMNIGQKQQPKEIIRLSLEKKLVLILLKNFGMVIKKKKN